MDYLLSTKIQDDPFQLSDREQKKFFRRGEFWHILSHSKLTGHFSEAISCASPTIFQIKGLIILYGHVPKIRYPSGQQPNKAGTAPWLS